MYNKNEIFEYMHNHNNEFANAFKIDKNEVTI